MLSLGPLLEDTLTLKTYTTLPINTSAVAAAASKKKQGPGGAAQSDRSSRSECLIDFERSLVLVLTLLVNVDLLDHVLAPTSTTTTKEEEQDLMGVAQLRRLLAQAEEAWLQVVTAAPSELARKRLQQSPVGLGLKADSASSFGRCEDTGGCLRALLAILEARRRLNVIGSGGISGGGTGLTQVSTTQEEEEEGGGGGVGKDGEWHLSFTRVTHITRDNENGANGPLKVLLSRDADDDDENEEGKSAKKNGGFETPAQTSSALSFSALPRHVSGQEREIGIGLEMGSALDAVVTANEQERRSAFVRLFGGAAQVVQRCVRRWLVNRAFYATRASSSSSLQATAAEFQFHGRKGGLKQLQRHQHQQHENEPVPQQQLLARQLLRHVRPWSLGAQSGCSLCGVSWPGDYLSYLNALRRRHSELTAELKKEELAAGEDDGEGAVTKFMGAAGGVENVKALATFERSEIWRILKQIDATEKKLAVDYDARSAAAAATSPAVVAESNGKKGRRKKAGFGAAAAASAAASLGSGGGGVLSLQASQAATRKVANLHRQAKTAFSKVRVCQQRYAFMFVSPPPLSPYFYFITFFNLFSTISYAFLGRFLLILSSIYASWLLLILFPLLLLRHLLLWLRPLLVTISFRFSARFAAPMLPHRATQPWRGFSERRARQSWGLATQLRPSNCFWRPLSVGTWQECLRCQRSLTPNLPGSHSIAAAVVLLVEEEGGLRLRCEVEAWRERFEARKTNCGRRWPKRSLSLMTPPTCGESSNSSSSRGLPKVAARTTTMTSSPRKRTVRTATRTMTKTGSVATL
jgi:hypothetical protein